MRQGPIPVGTRRESAKKLGLVLGDAKAKGMGRTRSPENDGPLVVGGHGWRTQMATALSTKPGLIDVVAVGIGTMGEASSRKVTAQG